MGTNKIDILHGKETTSIMRFALPIALSSMLQQLFNSADTAVVGRYADKNALAAVGTNGELVGLLVSVSVGLSVGINVLLAFYLGRNNREKIGKALHSSLLFAFSVGLFLAIVGQFITEPIMRLVNTPEEITEDATLYLQIYFAGLPALLIFDFGAAILRSKGDSRRPFIILVMSGIMNILLNLFFVIVCKMTVSGVAVATVISNVVSAICVLYVLGKENDEFCFRLKQLCFERESVRNIVKIGLPAALQLAVFCFANIFVQASVNTFGAVAIDGSTISMNYEYFTYYMITAFAQTATTFVSQNYGAGQYDRCRRILKYCLLFAITFCAAMTIPMTIFSDFFASLFSSDCDVIAAASQRILIILLLEPICSLYEVPAGYLRGMGDSAKPAVVTILGSCLFRIIWIKTVFRYFHNLQTLYIVFPLSWIITMAMMWAVFFHQKRKQRR